MVSAGWILIILLFPDAVGRLVQAKCTLSGYQHHGYYKDGDRIIGGFIPLTRHPSRTNHDFRTAPELRERLHGLEFKSYLHVLAMIHAVEEINKNPHLLPNVSLGFHIYNAVFDDETALAGLFGLLSENGRAVPNYHCGGRGGSKIVAVLEGPEADQTSRIATAILPYRYPQFSFGHLDPELRQKVRFPSLYGMVPSERSLLASTARLIRHFDWRWVGLVTSNDARGKRAVETLREEIDKGGGCVAFTWMLTEDAYLGPAQLLLLSNIQRSSANVTVLHGTRPYVETVGRILSWPRVHLQGRVWILTSQDEFPAENKFSSLKNFDRALALMGQKRQIPGFERFLRRIKLQDFQGDSYIKDFWRQVHNCLWLHSSWMPRCTGEENITISQARGRKLLSPTWGYSIYNAVYAVAHALHALFSERPPGSPKDFQAWQLLSSLNKVRFSNLAGDDIFFDPEGNLVAGYEIRNWVFSPDGNLAVSPVGSIRPQAPLGQELVVDANRIQWNRRFEQVKNRLQRGGLEIVVEQGSFYPCVNQTQPTAPGRRDP
ncbi:hypothetical protein lerEdw1_002956 [Lerista edwardsae]|nr:hypothetical protein lerEdw1_002956 [Lerista edwardsae]